MSQVHTLKCDLYREGHANGNYVQNIDSAEAQNANFQKNYPYSNTYNPYWKDHPYLKCRNNQTLSPNQGFQQAPQAPPRKSSPLVEALANFMKATKQVSNKLGKCKRKCVKLKRDGKESRYHEKKIQKPQ